jgi:formylglycine-generating enzyme required for sulfatase activity
MSVLFSHPPTIEPLATLSGKVVEKRGGGLLERSLPSGAVPRGWEPASDDDESGIDAGRWARIPAGRFLMGGIDNDKFVTIVELPRHEVIISKDFLIGRHPVTNAEWFAVTGEVPGASAGNSPLAPVVGVMWREAAEFCEVLGRRTGRTHRLPTEAEWEYVCRGGTTSVFPHGGDLTPRQANYLYDERGRQVGPGHPTEVGRYGENPFGVADLLGNVCEWTADHWHPDFHHAPADGTAWIDLFNPAPKRVIRGGPGTTFPASSAPRGATGHPRPSAGTTSDFESSKRLKHHETRPL